MQPNYRHDPNQGQQPPTTYQAGQDPAAHPQAYDFIMNPAKPTRQYSLPGGNSLLSRATIALVGLLVLVIILTILKGLFGGNTNFQEFVTVAQTQQELTHLSTNALEQQSLSTANKNFAVTSQLGLTSEQAELLSYLKNNGQKVKTKTLNLKISKATDSQLDAAASAGNYDSTFREVMRGKLTQYQQALKQAYTQTKGPKGRELLNKEYNSAGLLLTQLDTPSS